MRKTQILPFIGALIASFVVILAGAAAIAHAGQPEAVIWTDYDFKNIPEPKVRTIGMYDSAFRSEFADPIKRATDVPRWVRMAAGNPKQAANVNSLDEVPDSSWFTNRHALRHMTVAQLVRGPNRGAAPDFTKVTVTKAKLEGVTPGLQITDATGQQFLIKFDNKNYPELQSGAEVISTKILYAAGYNVPENYVAYLNSEKLSIKEGVEFTEGGKKRALKQEDLANMLRNVARRPDGTYRVLASKILDGKAKGPFAYVGLRGDDPNDLIPHEHRRELRGLRVLASWINQWDLKELNTLDMYVEEGGRKFLRHYLIDFGSSLGGGRTPTEYFHGREYAFDKGNILKELFSLGLVVTPDEKSTPIVYPEVGIFSANDFDPGDWKPSFQMVPFDNMTREDAFWATRIIMSFSDDDLLNIVKAAEYSNPKATDYIFRTLLDRRQQIATYWLRDLNPLSSFAVVMGKDGPEVAFEDLMSNHDLASKAQYRYEIWKSEGWTKSEISDVTRVPLGKTFDGQMRLRISTIRNNKASKPVILVVQSKTAGAYGLVRIERS